uniref:Peptidase M13 N-terminal domain-containing protein n=1 Tax=Biomphalaria glabrata TaxID=6526 RepID=A0A2C9M5F9_BIOGL
MMDTSVDPCEDMYQFSCGGWLRNNPLPEKQSRWIVMDTMKSKINEQLIQLLQSEGVTFKGHNSTAIRKLKILYKTCMDTDSIESQGFKPLIKLIDDLGSWTVSPTPGGWDRQKWSLQKALEKSHYLWGTSLWSTYIYKDAKNGSRNILHVCKYLTNIHFYIYICTTDSYSLVNDSTVKSMLASNHKDSWLNQWASGSTN